MCYLCEACFNFGDEAINVDAYSADYYIQSVATDVVVMLIENSVVYE
ncbi:hypothetical protein [Bartonella jaculi]|uniref:Uncharacterized protein n=1 Tax=Bartonella jaculi TaxID=686226 RepID=A0ABP9N5A0_9HYPH